MKYNQCPVYWRERDILLARVRIRVSLTEIPLILFKGLKGSFGSMLCDFSSSTAVKLSR